MLEIRHEDPEDICAVRRVNEQAFGRKEESDRLSSGYYSLSAVALAEWAIE